MSKRLNDSNIGNFFFPIQRLLGSIKCLLEELVNKPEIESLDPILYCDDDCNVTGGVAFNRDEESGEVISVFFDANLQPTDTEPSGSPCGPKCNLDYEIIKDCFENATTCERYQQLTVFSFKQGQKEVVSTCWVNPDGTITTELPANLQPCSDNCNCNPAMESFLGNGATLPNFHEFSTVIPECCAVKITTSAGEYVFDPVTYPRSICEEFECLISDYNIEIITPDGEEPKCTVDEIRTYLKRKS